MEHFVIDTNSVALAESPAPAAPRAREKRSVPSDGMPRGFMTKYQRVLKAKYDAAGMSPEMEAWWSNSDSLSPRASSGKATRSKLRNRARYECYESGSIANGMLEALTNAVIGCGPELQVLTDDKAFNKFVEVEWGKWAKKVNLTNKLRTLFAAKVVDGEGFAERTRNPRLATPVKFDLRLSEADLWTDPLDAIEDPQQDDGIRYDSWGNPISYKRLKQHPGDSFINSNPWETDTIRADFVLHWFSARRPDQRRGTSEFSSSLRPLAELRRYQMAVQAAAETAANHSGVMFSTAASFSESPDEIDEGDEFMNVSLSRNGLLTLPAGWDMKQLRAEQPSTKYVEFVEERIAAAARPFQMPLNVAIGSSRNHNFASSKVDKQQFHAANAPKKKDCADNVMTQVFGWFMFEFNRVPAYDALPNFGDEIPHIWQWPTEEPVDAVAQARSDEIYWNLGLLTDERYCKQKGIDVDELQEQWARQTAAREAVSDQFPQPGVNMSESLTPEEAADGQEAQQ